MHLFKSRIVSDSFSKVLYLITHTFVSIAFLYVVPGAEFSFFGLFSFEFSKFISKFLELTERYSSLSESSESISFFSIVFSDLLSV